MNQLDIFKKAETIGNISAFCDSCRTIGNHIIFTRRGKRLIWNFLTVVQFI